MGARMPSMKAGNNQNEENSGSFTTGSDVTSVVVIGGKADVGSSEGK
jgi:hypothetical protein